MALRSAGWTDTEITNLLLYIEIGDEKYKPKQSVVVRRDEEGFTR